MQEQQRERSLARYVSPPLDDARLERQWAAMRGRGLPDAPSRRRWMWLLAPAAAAVGAMLLWLSAPDKAPGSEGLPRGAVVRSADEGFDLQLRDGSMLALAPHTELRVGRDTKAGVEIELARGRASFDVRKRAGRRFVVRSGEAVVSVVGTRFAVARAGDRLSVEVEEGRVEVWRRDRSGRSSTLGPGERLRLTLGDPPPQQTTKVVPAEVEPPAQQAATPQKRPAPHDPAERPRGAHDPAERSRAPARESASEIFERGNLARRAGRVREAATAYEALLARHGDDARVALAAFELGRLRMDALDDPAGAIRAFRRALAQGEGGSHHEDAMARIALAHDALGDGEACRKARERYLSRYPAGVHRADLASRCD